MAKYKLRAGIQDVVMTATKIVKIKDAENNGKLYTLEDGRVERVSVVFDTVYAPEPNKSYLVLGANGVKSVYPQAFLDDMCIRVE